MIAPTSAPPRMVGQPKNSTSAKNILIDGTHARLVPGQESWLITTAANTNPNRARMPAPIQTGLKNLLLLITPLLPVGIRTLPANVATIVLLAKLWTTLIALIVHDKVDSFQPNLRQLSGLRV